MDWENEMQQDIFQNVACLIFPTGEWRKLVSDLMQETVNNWNSRSDMQSALVAVMQKAGIATAKAENVLEKFFDDFKGVGVGERIFPFRLEKGFDAVLQSFGMIPEFQIFVHEKKK